MRNWFFFKHKQNQSLSTLILKCADPTCYLLITRRKKNWIAWFIRNSPADHVSFLLWHHKENSTENLWSPLSWKSLVCQWIWGIYPSSAPHSRCNLRCKPFSWPIMLHHEQKSHCANILGWMTQRPPFWNRIYNKEFLLHRIGKCVAIVHVIFFQLHQLYRFFLVL